MIYPITELSEIEIIDFLKNSEMKPETKNSWLNVILMVRRYKKVSVDKLLFYRGYREYQDDGTYKMIGGELNQDIQVHKMESKEKVSKELPTMKDLNDHLTSLYKSKKYRDYIINYLLVNYGVRNKDLDIVITKDKKVISNTQKNKDNYQKNYLYVVKSYVWFICNEYKTASTFGRKKIKIRNTSFQRSVNGFIGTGEKKLLVNTIAGTTIKNDAGIAKVVQEKTFNKIGEGKIFKVIIKDILNEPNAKVRENRLRSISETRGTSIGTILQSYAVDVPV